MISAAVQSTYGGTVVAGSAFAVAVGIGSTVTAAAIGVVGAGGAAVVAVGGAILLRGAAVVAEAALAKLADWAL